MTFQLLSNLPSGHRLFVTDERVARYAIADESGRTPDLTDDGALFIDLDEWLMATDNGCLVMLRDEAGEQTRTTVDVATMFVLAERFDMGINVRGILFKVERA